MNEYSSAERAQRLNEDLQQRMSQRNANSMNGDMSFLKRNGANAGAALDYVGASIQNRFTDPQSLMHTIPQLGQSAANGAQRAAAEREQRRALEKEQRATEAEEKKAAKAVDELKKLRDRNLTEGVGNVIGVGADWLIGTPDPGHRAIVKNGVTGSNVSTYRNGNGETINIAKDTRTQGQRRADAAANVAKDLASGYVQSVIDAGLNKVSDLGGYAAAKAKFAIEDMKERRAQAKLAQEQAKVEKKFLNQQKNTNQ